MTRKLYDDNAYLTEFEAVVLECKPLEDKWRVLLDKTAFFPEGGGQLSDIGTLGGAIVSDVQIVDDKIYHTTDIPLTPSATVKGSIDFNRRFDFMQQHSGEHIVSGVAHSLFGCENTGFHLGLEFTTLDFDKILSEQEVLLIQKEANEKIFKNVKFKAFYPDGETLEKTQYRSKKELSGDIRIVEIEDTDACACCAPHVNFAGEIGIISLDIMEKVRGGVRLKLKCGNRALKEIEEMKRNLSSISSALCVKQNETADGVNRLLNQIADLKYKNTALKNLITENKVSAFNSEQSVTAEFEEDMDIKELQHYADALYKKAGGIRGVFSQTDGGYLFVFCGEPNKTDEFFKGFRENFNLKGGGRNGMVQGTVVATKDQLCQYINIFK